jgi:hypothetical protein
MGLAAGAPGFSFEPLAIWRGFLLAGNLKWGESGERMSTDRKRKGLYGFTNKPQALVLTVVPGARIELAQPQGPRDFKSKT